MQAILDPLQCVRWGHDCDNRYVLNLTAVYPSFEGSLLSAACSIAGVGFFFWGIHAIRKMREPLFNEDEDKGKCSQFPFPYHRLTSTFAEEPNGDDRATPFPLPSVENGVVQPLSLPDRVRIRLALSEPEEPFNRVSAPISTEAYDAQGSVNTPRMPQRAGGQSQRTSSHRSSRHVSPMQGGPYGERYENGANDEHIKRVIPSRETSLRRSSRHVSPMQGGPYGEIYEYGANNEHIKHVSPSRVASSRRSSRHVPPMQGGPYDERYEYGVNDEYVRRVSPSRETSSRRSNHQVSPMQGGPYGERYEYGVNNEYIRSVNPSHRSGTGHGPHQSMRRMNEDPTTYAYAY